VSPPAISIVVELESSAPKVVMDALTEGECDRLLSWLAGRPELRLVADAIRLAEERGE